jgi:hypothetical protein
MTQRIEHPELMRFFGIALIADAAGQADGARSIQQMFSAPN